MYYNFLVLKRHKIHQILALKVKKRPEMGPKLTRYAVLYCSAQQNIFGTFLNDLIFFQGRTLFQQLATGGTEE